MKGNCNQHFVKDSHRNNQYIATIKCSCCKEESNWEKPYPFELKEFNKWLDDFTKLHNSKGCNKNIIDKCEWESTSFSFGLSI